MKREIKRRRTKRFDGLRNFPDDGQTGEKLSKRLTYASSSFLSVGSVAAAAAAILLFNRDQLGFSCGDDGRRRRDAGLAL